MANPIPFHRPAHFARAFHHYLGEVEAQYFSSETPFLLEAESRLEALFGRAALLVGSGTQALELVAMEIAGEFPGGSVIVPSFAFSSCANAFLRAGLKVRFCDVEMDGSASVRKIAEQVRDDTVAVLLLLYGGRSDRAGEIQDFCRDAGLKLVVDAAHSVGARYGALSAVDVGDFSCVSFHFTKNISAGEGGAVFLPKGATGDSLCFRRDKGTDRSRKLLGLTDKYTWQILGGNFRIAPASLALLMSQLDHCAEITASRRNQCLRYFRELGSASLEGFEILGSFTDIQEGNGHLFGLIAPDALSRDFFITEMAKRQISCHFHYQALHESPLGRQLAGKGAAFPNSSALAERLVRLPVFFGLCEELQGYVIESVLSVLKRAGATALNAPQDNLLPLPAAR